MITSRRMTTTPSAGLARARLLHDLAQTRFPEPSSPSMPYAAGLSPDDQTRYAIQIARSFKHHFLTEVRYLADRHVAVATLKPIDLADIPHTIFVDANGNVDVTYDFSHRTAQPSTHRWMLLTLGSVVIALIALLTTMTMI